MPEAYIVDAIRTPTGKRRGSLAEVHGADLGAHVLRAIVERNAIPDVDYDDVMFGCLDAIGPLAGDIARTCWLAAGLSDEVPGTTIDRQCGSSQQAVHFAAQAVMAGVNDVVVAGGVQTMSKIPISAAMIAAQPLGFSDPFSGSQGWRARYGDVQVSQFNSAQMIADKWKISREQMEAFALESHTRALRAIAEGRFDREIVPMEQLAMDETPRHTSMEKMASLEPLAEGGTITAGVSSQTCDGASAMLIVSEDALKRYNLTPRARIAHMSVRAEDPHYPGRSTDSIASYNPTNGTESLGNIFQYGGDPFWIGVVMSSVNRTVYATSSGSLDRTLDVDGVHYLHRLPPPLK